VSPKKYTCDRCDFKSADRFRYSNHRRWCVHLRRPEENSCPVCHKTFKRPQGLGNHVRFCKAAKPKRAAARSGVRGGSRLAKALARKRDKLRAKGIAFLAVAEKIDLMIGALRKVE
jgi:hypothetical protein